MSTPQDYPQHHPHIEMNRMLADIRFLALRAEITELLELIVEECRGTNRPDGYLISEEIYAAVKAAVAKVRGEP